jgi:hypothetical protein
MGLMFTSILASCAACGMLILWSSRPSQTAAAIRERELQILLRRIARKSRANTR